MTKVPIAHIQSDFEIDYENGGEFYINVDVSPNSVIEYRVHIDAGSATEVSRVDNGLRTICNDGSFTRQSNGSYKFEVNGKIYWFKTPKRLVSTEELGISENLDLISCDASTDKIVIGDSGGGINVYDHEWMSKLSLVGAHVSDVTTVKIFPSNAVLLSGSTDMQLKVWSLEDGSNPRTLKGHSAGITDTIIIERGRNVLSSSLDGSVRLWELGSGKTISKFCRKENTTDGVTSMSLLVGEQSTSMSAQVTDRETGDRLEFGTEGKQVFAGHLSGTITVHDLFNKQQILQIPSSFVAPCNTIAQISEHAIVSGYEDGTVATWDIRKPQQYLQKLDFAGNAINKILNWKDKLFLSSGLDNTFEIASDSGNGKIDITSATHLATEEVNNFVIVPSAPSSRLLAVGKWGLCGIYDI